MRAVAWLGCGSEVTKKLAAWAGRTMDIVKTNEDSKPVQREIRLLTRGVALQHAVWEEPSALKIFGVEFNAKGKLEMTPDIPDEKLRVCSQLKARAEALRWLCTDGRILDSAGGKLDHNFLIESCGLERVVLAIREKVPFVLQVAGIAKPLPLALDANELLLASAALRVYLERWQEGGLFGPRRYLSTFGLYSARSALSIDKQEEVWHLACHMFIHARRAAQNSNKHTIVKEPKTWQSLHAHRDLFGLAHRVRKIDPYIQDSSKRRRLF